MYSNPLDRIAAVRRYQKTDKGKATLRRYRQSDKYKKFAADQQLRLHYGISLSEYDKLLEKQDGRCAICGEPQSDSRGHRLHVDHNHETKVIRGLLCGNCNQGLGRFKDSTEFLQSAIDYLNH